MCLESTFQRYKDILEKTTISERIGDKGLLIHASRSSQQKSHHKYRLFVKGILPLFLGE